MSTWQGSYMKDGKSWCKCCGTRPEYCPNYKKRPRKEWTGVNWKGGKDWCKCCGTRPAYCPNYKNRNKKK